MITEGEFEKGGKKYNRKLELSDWRYSAAALGMDKFFESMDIDRYKEKRAIYYNIEDVAYNEETNDSKYLMFVEKYFPEMMHHRIVEKLMEKKELNDKEIKYINKILLHKSFLGIFKEIKYSKKNEPKIKELIDRNRLEIIRGIFRNNTNGYSKFINTKKGYSKFDNKGKFELFKDTIYRKNKKTICRLLGFYVDIDRKTNSLGFAFNEKSRTINDEIEFDFIPFAFSKENESVFINNNISWRGLISSNNMVTSLINTKKAEGMGINTLFYNYIGSIEYLGNNVEIIKKSQDIEFYESIFLRRQSIEIFKELGREVQIDAKLKPLDITLNRKIETENKYNIDIMQEVTYSIINIAELDNLIDKILNMSQKEDIIKKNKGNIDSYLINNLIRVNVSIYKSLKRLEKDMDKDKYLGMAAMSAKSVVEYFKKNTAENKIRSYRQKLTSAIVARDYDRFIEIMLQLSSYTQMAFPFLHKLISDFEVNKNLAYAFVNRLLDNNTDKEMKGDINSEK